jgi:segregation and condensation protein B
MDDEIAVMDCTSAPDLNGAAGDLRITPDDAAESPDMSSDRASPDGAQALVAPNASAPPEAKADPGAVKANQPLRRILEALLFGSDAPLSASKLADLAGGSQTEVRLELANLNDTFRDAGLSFRIEQIAGGYQLMTLPEFQPWLARLHRHAGQTRLSDAALETLSIIAYRQPIIRADIEAIRGVACGDVVNRLREMGLVKVVGRAEIVGRPLVYATTKKFLDVFGLADLNELPPMEALSLRPVRAAIPAISVPPAVLNDAVEGPRAPQVRAAAGA